MINCYLQQNVWNRNTSRTAEAAPILLVASALSKRRKMVLVLDQAITFWNVSVSAQTDIQRQSERASERERETYQYSILNILTIINCSLHDSSCTSCLLQCLFQTMQRHQSARFLYFALSAGQIRRGAWACVCPYIWKQNILDDQTCLLTFKVFKYGWLCNVLYRDFNMIGICYALQKRLCDWLTL